VSQNEVAFSSRKPSQFYLYRGFNYDPLGSTGLFIKEPLDISNFRLTPIQFRVKDSKKTSVCCSHTGRHNGGALWHWPLMN
jgi:hypothetical protein